MKSAKLNALSDLEDDLAGTVRLVTVAYMAAADLEDDGADPMRTLLNLIVERLYRSKAVLSEIRLGKAEKF